MNGKPLSESKTVVVPTRKGKSAARIETLNLVRSGAGSESCLDKNVALMAARRRARPYVRLGMVCADLAALLLAFVITGTLRLGTPFDPLVWTLAAVLIPAYLGVAANQHAFGIEAAMGPRAGTRRALIALMITLGVVGLAVFFLKASDDFSRAVLGISTLVSTLFIGAFRQATARLLRRLYGMSLINEVVVLDGGASVIAAEAIIFDTKRDDLAPQLDNPAMLDKIGHSFCHADRVLIACSADRRDRWSAALKGADVRAEVFAPELEALGAIGLGSFHGQSTAVIASGPLGLFDRSLKRALDLILVGVSLPIALPLMLIIGIAIKLDTPGPIFFSQERVGLGNRIFRMYKFRSMHMGQLDVSGQHSTERQDRRVTRVGRFIRRTSLDELPQVFNIVQGVMSAVGPRPHPLGSRAEGQLFWDIDTQYWHRHATKPGLTGLAQVRGYRGATEKIGDLQNRLQADLEYLSGWTIWRDVEIILRTFRVMVHKNAF